MSSPSSPDKSLTRFGNPRHGTHSGYVRHRQKQEAACDDCRIAHTHWKSVQDLRSKFPDLKMFLKLPR